MIRKKIYREHFLSEICPKIEKTTDYQWFLSGWQDSNLRPPGPKPGAMTGLRYTPKRYLLFFTGANIQCLQTHYNTIYKKYSNHLNDTTIIFQQTAAFAWVLKFFLMHQ